MNKLKNADRRLVTILLIVFVQMLGAAMILPILPLYAKNEFSMSAETITLLITAFFAAQFIAGPYLGRLSDRIGRMPVLIISQIGTAISFLMLAWAPSVLVLFLARILDGITGGNIIVAQAYITDITPREKRTQSLGYIFAVFGLGFIFGPALGGLLSGLFDPRTPYIIAAVAATIVVVLTWFTLDESLTTEQREENRRFRRGSLAPREVVRNVPLVLILIIAFVGQFGLGMLQATFALYGEAVLFAEYSTRVATVGIGLLLAVIGVGQFLTQAFILPRALKRFDETWLVIAGILVRTLAMAIYAIIASWFIAGIAGLFFAIGMGIMMPSLQSLATTTVPDQLRGGVLGVYQSTISLTVIISTAISGVIFSLNPTAPDWIGAVLTLLVLPPAIALARRKELTSPSQPPSVPTPMD